MQTYRVVPLGGCPLNIPLGLLRARGQVTSAFAHAGFRRWPLALSPAGANQLLSYGLSKRGIPFDLRGVCYQDFEDEPRQDSAPEFFAADILLMEISTPVDIEFEGYLLNQNHLRVYLTERAERIGPDAMKLVTKWNSHGLAKQNADLCRDCAEQIIAMLPEDERAMSLFARLLRDTRSSLSDYNRTLRELRALIATLGIPVGMILHNFSYMADGRIISWPGDFKTMMMAVAKELHIPTYDPAPLVIRHGVTNAMAADMRHYQKDFYEIVADEYVRFIASIV